VLRSSFSFVSFGFALTRASGYGDLAKDAPQSTIVCGE
jgi:hypothetical protein